jgi:hypothetical protein
MIQLTYSECLIKQGKREEAAKHLNDALASFIKARSSHMAARAREAISKMA